MNKLKFFPGALGPAMNGFVEVSLIVFLLFVVFGASWIYSRSYTPRKNWLSTVGIVSIYRVTVKKDTLGEEIYEPMIKCLYKANGVTYSIPLKDMKLWKYSQREWENIAHYYPVNTSVTVEYDPKRPWRARLKQ
jgi:hypothetical protein